MKYQNLLLVLSLFICTNLFSQTLLFGGNNGNGNFENGSADWVIVNGSQTNKWVVSNNATPGFSGNNSIYISSSPAAPYAHSYNVNVATYSYFYKDVAIPAGTKKVWLVFDYISNGEWTKDAYGTLVQDGFRIYPRTISTAITAGQELPGNFFISGAYFNQPAWQRKCVRYLDVTGFEGSIMRVVFQWENNGSGGNQPPAALDNVEMYASCQTMIAPSQGSTRGATISSIVWSTVSGATGYEIRYRKFDDPTTVATYSNPITVNGGNSYYTTLANLSPASSYLVEMRPIGTSCNEWTAAGTITTLTPPANDNCSGATMLNVETDGYKGTLASFLGATPTSGLASNCPNGANDDVWFQFTAQQSKQIIQTMDDEDYFYYNAKNITLFSGTCNNLQPVSLPCATESTSAAHRKSVTKLVATGLTVGTTYFIRVNSVSNNSSETFKISVHNEPPLPQCPQLLEPANNTVDLNQGIPLMFRWNKVDGAYSYLLRIQQSQPYTVITSNIYTSDTSFAYAPEWGGTSTWEVIPYNVVDGTATCSKFNFTACPSLASGITITSASTDKCGIDSIKITATPAGANGQWFLDGQLLPGATGDSIWAKFPGSYTVRALNSVCYSNPSNNIIIRDLLSPAKPVLNAQGATTFCQGGSITLSPSFDWSNQWFTKDGAINGATGSSYTATQSGAYYVRTSSSSSGCSNYSDTIIVTVKPVPAAPVIAANGNLTFCAGENAVLSSSASNGNQWYKYGAAIGDATGQAYTATQSGTYTVATTENGCTSAQSASVNVTVYTLPVAPTITANKALTICSGDSVRLQSSATAGNQWFKDNVAIAGATGQQLWVKEAGTYAVKASSNGCVSTASTGIAVTIHPLQALPAITVTGNRLAVESGSASYQWFLNKELITGATSSQYTVQQNGLYKVEVTSSNGCKIASNEFNFVASAVNEIVWTDYTISLYPNPVQDQLTIKVAASNSAARRITADVLDMKGKQVRTISLKAGLNSLSLKGLPQGVYSILIKSEKGQSAIQVVKTH